MKKVYNLIASLIQNYVQVTPLHVYTSNGLVYADWLYTMLGLQMIASCCQSDQMTD